MAAFLYGLPTTGVLQLPFTTNFADSSNMLGFFFQDNWKVTRKLTLNIGVRYEREGAMWERYNRSVKGFNPTAPAGIRGAGRSELRRQSTATASGLAI